MLVPMYFDTLERPKSHIDGELPFAYNNSLLNEFEDFANDNDNSLPKNDLDLLDIDRHPEPENGPFAANTLDLEHLIGLGNLDYNEMMAIRNRSLTFNVPYAIQNEMLMGLGQSAMDVQQTLKPRMRRHPRHSFDFDDKTHPDMGI